MFMFLLRGNLVYRTKRNTRQKERPPFRKRTSEKKITILRDIFFWRHNIAAQSELTGPRTLTGYVHVGFDEKLLGGEGQLGVAVLQVAG